MIILYYIALILFIIVCLITCFAVLIQESKSMGLGASVGGESANAFFGASTADVIKKFTAVMGGIFLVSCLVLSLWSAAMEPTKLDSRALQIEESN